MPLANRRNKDIWKSKNKGIDLSNLTEVKDPKSKDPDEKSAQDALIKPKKQDDPTYIEKSFFS